MTDETNLRARITDLEQLFAARRRAGTWFRLLAAAGILLFVGLFSLNAWLVNVQFSDLAAANTEKMFWLICHSRATPQQRTEAFLQLIEAGNTEWRSARLEKLQLDGAQLDGLQIEQANLDGSNLSGASLIGSHLRGSGFRLADLSKANLTKAEMVETDLLKATLDQANLLSANLRAASLEQAHAHKSQLVMADLSDAHLLMTDFTEANLTGANLTGANLEAAILKRANLALANLSRARLSDVDLTDSNWWRTRGLTSHQIAEYKEKFPPTKNAEPSRRRDFQLWLNSTKNLKTPGMEKLRRESGDP